MALQLLASNIIIPASISITANISDSTTGFILDSNVLLPVSVYNYSTWDLQWLIPNPTLGFWSYYCPDEYCQGPGWKTVSTPKEVPQGWITMGAFRFLGSSSGSTTAVATLLGVLSMNIGITVTSNFIQDSKKLPYTSYSPSTCSIFEKKTLSAQGLAEVDFPWAPFAANSPVRPICMDKVSSNLSEFEMGDLFVTPNAVQQKISISSWYSYASNIAKPAGFTPLTFTASGSKNGVIDNALKLVSKDVFSIKTPQVDLTYAATITSSKDAGALVYNISDGSSYYLAPFSWNDDPKNPLRLGFKIDLSAQTLIFGTLNNTINSVLPAILSQKTYYVGSWLQKKFTFFFSKIMVEIIGNDDIAFSITPYSKKAGDGPFEAFTVAFTKTPVLILSYDTTGVGSSLGWGEYKTSWNLIPSNTSVGGIITARIEDAGVYGILSLQKVNSAKALFLSNFLPIFLFWAACFW